MDSKRTLVVCLNPTFQQTMVFDHLWEGEVNRCPRHYLDASGKGMNVARVLAQAGNEATLLTHLGGPRINEMLDLMKADDVEVSWCDSDSPMRTCTTIINEEHRCTTELVQEPYPVAFETDTHIRELFDQAILKAEVLVITGTRTPGYSTSLYSDMVRIAKQHGKYVILDVKGQDLLSSLPYHPDIIKPNLSEFAATFISGATVKEQEANEELKEAVIEKAKALFKQWRVTTIITRGNYPVWCIGSQGFIEIPTQPVQPVNTIGCGDAFTAGLAKGVLEKLDLQQSIQQAIHFGTLNAQIIRPGSIVSLQ